MGLWRCGEYLTYLISSFCLSSLHSFYFLSPERTCYTNSIKSSPFKPLLPSLLLSAPAPIALQRSQEANNHLFIHEKPPQQLNNETYSNFTLCVLEARHRVGKPLKDRTFPILQMTCSAVDTSSLTPAAATSTDKTQHQPVHGHKEKKEFLVISVTVPDYFHSSSFRKDSETHHVGNAETHHPVEKDTVIASYASIERIRQVDLSGEEDRTGKIEWLMALTSDARGILPRWIQNLAVPGQIAKDVPLFLGWIGKERKNEGRFKDEGRRDEKKEKTRKIGK